MTTVNWAEQGMHSPGANHAVAWLDGTLSKDLTGSEVLTLSVVCNLADHALCPGNEDGYYGETALGIASVMRVSEGIAKRRLDRLVEAGALVTKPWLTGVRYWLPDEVNLP